jgi:RimJ/RimL family protein N-acetyltransferase
MIDVNLFRGQKIRLTAVSKEDLPTITRWYEDASFGRLFDAKPALPKSEAQWTKRLEKIEKDEDGYFFAIRRLEDDLLIGIAELDGILWTHQNCWLSIGLGDRANWGQGYGREAMELLLKYAFNELNMHRVQLTVFSYNERAIALYEGLGFTREGIYREHLHRDGRRYDMYLYGLLRSEWEEHLGMGGEG